MEDWVLWFSLAAGAAFALIAINFLRKYTQPPVGGQETGTSERRPGQNSQQQNRVFPGGNRSATAAGRNRRQMAARRADDSDSDVQPARLQGQAQGQPNIDISDDEKEDRLPGDSKLGAKKRAKLEAKEEKRQQREVEERLRAEKKTKEAKELEERKKQEEEEEQDEKNKLEEAKRLHAEQLQKEEDDYRKMIESFTVEAGGFAVAEPDAEENLLEKFVEYIKEKKVILFEELATKFELKVPDTISRLEALVANGRLTGVMDDRGKFIYISQEELEKFAKFIKQRGRVSISDLVENSSSIITITQESQLASTIEV